MTFLVDTHAFLWFVWNDSRLSAVARTLMNDANNDVWLSIASCWEIAIKAGGKAKLG
jgi:PIN domain nuclease of toxin-antitoxin system